MKIITIHSFKGGTGKTTFVANIATILAQNNYNTVILDLDFSGPSLYYLMNVEPVSWINNYLDDMCTHKELLVNVQEKFNLPAKFLVGLANPAPSAITDVLSKGRRWQMNALSKLMRLKNILEQDGIDFIVIDTSPGLRYESINAVLLSDITFVLLNIDNFDIYGTKYMIQGFYEDLDKDLFLILNKVPIQFAKNNNFMEDVKNKLKEISPKINFAGVIPCISDVFMTLSKEILALTKPDSPFIASLKKILSDIIGITIPVEEINLDRIDTEDDCCA